MTGQSYLPSFDLEVTYKIEGYNVIAGVDEVGRGCIAGPVTAGAVIFKSESFPEGLDDSKKLTPQKRNQAYAGIKKEAIFALAHVAVEEIEELNILQASLKAMTLAVNSLPLVPDLVLVDGNWTPPHLPCESVAIVKGDQKSLTIAAASVVAKVNRDKLMCQLHKEEPQYKWHNNKGYGTREHLQALKKFGPSRHHRKSFLPLRKLFED